TASHVATRQIRDQDRHTRRCELLVVSFPFPGRVLAMRTTRMFGARALESLRNGGLWLAVVGVIVKILLANPRGVCAGVDRAIKIVELALEVFGPPVFVRKEIVHNSHVVGDLRQRGAVFVDDLEEVPPGSWAIFSAHGVSPAVFRQAEARGLKVI